MSDSASSNYLSSNYLIDEDHYIYLNRLSTDAINDLRIIAMRIYSSGFLHECFKVYARERNFFMSVEKLSINSCRRLEWEQLEIKIKMWILTAKICFYYIFEHEKQMCEQIFQGLGDEAPNSCLMETITDHTIQLLDTAEALTCIRPAPERLFRILDIHDTLSDLIPVIDNLFHSQSSGFIKKKVVIQIIPKLADKANVILLMFRKSLVNEQSPVVDAEPIHRLSEYVMHYVFKLCDRKKTLMKLSLTDIAPSRDAAGSFLLYVDWIVTSLVSNLEVKSKFYKDPVASHFFAMNNFHYIIQMIQAQAELLEIYSLNKLICKFEHARSDYLKLTFNVALRYLRDEGLNKIKILSFKVLKLAYKVKRFNGEFEKLEKDLGKVVVPDSGLALELRKLIIEMVVTAYTSFLVRVKKTPRLEAYVKYSAEGIESAIQKFFECDPDQ